MFNINTQPTERQLRQFGLISLIAMPAITWLWTRSQTATITAACLGLACGLLALVAPRTLKPVFILLTLLAMPIGLVVGELAMMLVYAIAFVPMAIVFRIIGRDSMQRKLSHDAESYWQKHVAQDNVKRYYRQF
jgi:hypothetical protein